MSFQTRIYNFIGLSTRIIAIIFLARLVRDTNARMIFPFIFQLSQGLGLTVVVFSWLLFVQSMAGITGPIFGILSDKYGRRRIMVIGLVCQGIGAIGLAMSQHIWAVLPMFILGVGMSTFIPTQQAYISDQVSYQKRGRALAAIEVSWALTAILILPIIGWLIDTFNWRVPFFIVGFFALLGAAMVWFGLPKVERLSQNELSWATVKAVLFRPNVVGAIMVNLFLFMGMGSFLSLWGIWLTHDFALGAVQLGLVATAIGITELGGSVSSSLFIDKIGKKRGAGLGLLLSAIAFLLLPVTQSLLPLAIVGLVVLGLLLEFTIVSLIPLYSEQVPHARGTVLSLIAMGAAIGMAIGPPLTANLWEKWGLWAVSSIAAICMLIAITIMWTFLHED